MKSFLAKFKSFRLQIVQMGALQKLQNSIQTHNFVACLPNPYKLSILGDIWRAANLPFSASEYFYSW